MPALKKVRDIVLWSIIFLLPTQIGYHFWPDFSFVAGFRIDYLSPTLYLTDILIFTYILQKFFLGWQKILVQFIRSRIFWQNNLLIFTVFILVIIFASINSTLTLFSWGKIIFYLLFFIFLRQEKNLIRKIQSPLILSTILIIGLEIAQLIKQQSLNGIFYWLGERNFNLSTPNIAKLNIQGTQLLRPYSTFSHPNSFAGFLLLIYILFKPKYQRGKFFKIFFQNIIILGILITFSKAAALALLAILIYQKLEFKLKTLYFKIILITSLTISLLPLFANYISLSFNPSSTILSRLYLGPPTLAIIKQNLIMGVGLNNFIPALAGQLSPSHIFAHTLQPIHSIPLLAISELGLIGIVLIVWFTKKYLLKGLTLKGRLYDKGSDLIVLLIILAITSSVDHYWWTLHQNHLILILVLAILFQKNTNREI